MLTVRLSASLACLASLALGGCGLSSFSPRRDDPIIRDYVSNGLLGQEMLVAGLSTTSTYRTAYIVPKDGGVEVRTGDASSFRRILVCPEPPPDVAQAVASEFAGALKAAASEPRSGVTGNVSGGLASSFQTAVLPLVRRTQGLQYFRDGNFFACVAYLNGIISEDEYRQRLRDLQQVAGALIAQEVSQPVPENPVTVNVENPADAAALLDKLQQPSGDQGQAAQEGAAPTAARPKRTGKGTSGDG
jgi:hypothetical protein